MNIYYEMKELIDIGKNLETPEYKLVSFLLGDECRKVYKAKSSNGKPTKSKFSNGDKSVVFDLIMEIDRKYDLQLKTLSDKELEEIAIIATYTYGQLETKPAMIVLDDLAKRLGFKVQERKEVNPWRQR